MSAAQFPVYVLTDEIARLREALRMACRDLAAMRKWQGHETPPPSEADVDDIVAEFLGKARGYKAEDGE